MFERVRGVLARKGVYGCVRDRDRAREERWREHKRVRHSREVERVGG